MLHVVRCLFGPCQIFFFFPLFFLLFFQGYGFCEWMDPSVTEKACEGLNGMNLLGKTLTGRRAQPGSGG